MWEEEEEEEAGKVRKIEARKGARLLCPPPSWVGRNAAGSPLPHLGSEEEINLPLRVQRICTSVRLQRQVARVPLQI